jgi:hypothetical protein
VDDKIYITTFKEVKGQNQMVILDLNGKLIKKTLVPLLNVNMVVPVLFHFYTIANNKIYRLEENPDSETWELFVTDI